MEGLDLALLLIVVVGVGGLAARPSGVPAPALLLLVGVVATRVPGVPDIGLDPRLVLELFLPALLYSAALQSSVAGFRDNARAIGLLSVGLVLATTLAVGVVAHLLVPDLPWGAALALGAIVGPPDAVARAGGGAAGRDAGAAVHHHRGREPRQRRDRAHQLSVGGGGRRRRGLQPARRGRALPARRGRRGRRGAAGRLGGAADPRRDRRPWQLPAAVSWAGMRGVVSLAAAVALPLTDDAGRPFPQRDLLVFVVFVVIVVIVVTLLVQGLTFGPVLRRLGLRADRQGALLQQAGAQQAASAAAVQRLDEVLAERPAPDGIGDTLRTMASHRSDSAWERLGAVREGMETPSTAHRRLRGAMISAEREALVRLRAEGRLSDEAMRELQRELDLEELQLPRS